MNSTGILDGVRLALTIVLLAVVCVGAIPIASATFQLLAASFHSIRNHYGRAAPFLPRVAVLIPAWNEEKVIGRTVERLLALDYPPESLRVWVVDDASTDATAEIVGLLAQRHPGSVMHLRREVGGQGKAHTLNHGLRETLRDDWMEAVLITDADVIFHPSALRRMTRHLADEHVGAVTAYIREGSGSPNYLTRFIGFEYVLAQLAGRRAQNVLGAMACLAGGAQLHSRHNIEALGGEVDTSTLAEDTVTTFETQLRGRRAVFEPHAVALAEEPRTVQALWRQRVRWARGNLQVTRRYRRLWFRFDRDRHLGAFSFAIQWFSVLLLPFVMVFVPIGLIGLFLLDNRLESSVFRTLWIGAACVYVYSIVFGLQLDRRTARTSWRAAVALPGVVSLFVIATALTPDLIEKQLPSALGLGEFSAGMRDAWTIFVYGWVSIAMVVAWLAKVVERTRLGPVLTPVLIYIAGYGPLLCAVTVDAYFKQLRGADTRWEKTEKTGRVRG